MARGGRGGERPATNGLASLTPALRLLAPKLRLACCLVDVPFGTPLCLGLQRAKPFFNKATLASPSHLKLISSDDRSIVLAALAYPH